MAEPSKTPASSDIDGVNRDARVSKPQRDPEPNAGKQLDQAKKESIGRPEESPDEERIDNAQ